MEDRKRSQQVEQEIAIVVRVVLPSDPVDLSPLDEIQGLAETAGAIVVGGMVQRRDKPDNTAYLGKGKVAELAELVEFHAADFVIFDNELSAAQNRNLEVATGVKVLDRTELILDIFATHAQTYESRLARRTSPTGILPTATQANVDSPFTNENGRRHAWSR